MVMVYIKSLYVVMKPVISYFGVKSAFLLTTYSAEWYSGRAYSIYCIGEGFEGFRSHIWNIASPSCSGLLMSHISFLGVFIASIGLTFISGLLYIYKHYMKDEYNNSKILIEEIKDLKKNIK
jgi:hypothetical protein